MNLETIMSSSQANRIFSRKVILYTTDINSKNSQDNKNVPVMMTVTNNIVFTCF